MKPRYIFLFFFPLLMIFASKPMARWAGPYTYDPDYGYLLTALSVLKIDVPYYRDHPGTTLQTLGALTLRVAHPTLTRQEIIERVFTDPEKYLSLLILVLVTVCAACVAASGILVARSLKSLWLGLLFQILPFLCWMAWAYFGRLTSDDLALSLGMLLAAVVCAFEDRKLAIFSGLIIGAVLATKVTSLPILLLPIAMLWRSRKNFLALAVASAASYVFCILPLFLKLKESIAYILFFRTRTKEEHVLTPFLLLSRMFQACIESPTVAIALFAVLAAGVFAFFSKRTGAKTKVNPLVLAGVVFAQVLMVSSFGPPADHARYVFPAYGAAALLIVLLISKLRWKWTAPLATGVAAFWSLSIPYAQLVKPLQNESLTAQIDKTVKDARCEVMPVYSSTTLDSALLFGDHRAGSKFGKELFAARPKTIFYSVETPHFSNFAREEISLELMKKSQTKYCVVNFNLMVLPVSDSVIKNSLEASHIAYKPLLTIADRGSVFLLELNP